MTAQPVQFLYRDAEGKVYKTVAFEGYSFSAVPRGRVCDSMGETISTRDFTPRERDLYEANKGGQTTIYIEKSCKYRSIWEVGSLPVVERRRNRDIWPEEPVRTTRHASVARGPKAKVRSIDTEPRLARYI